MAHGVDEHEHEPTPLMLFLDPPLGDLRVQKKVAVSLRHLP